MFDKQIQTAISISLFDLSISLFLATCLALVGIGVYRYTHRSLNYEKSFLTSLLLIAPIVAVIIMLIGSNLAMSLGMVGALSIIRFRTAIKDPRDMIYLFWMITIGLGCGTYNLKVSILFTIFIAIMLIILDFFQFGKSKKNSYVIVLKGSGSEIPAEAKTMITDKSSLVEFRSIDVNDNHWEAVFEMSLKDNESLLKDDLVKNLSAVGGVKTVSFMAPQLSLPL